MSFLDDGLDLVLHLAQVATDLLLVPGVQVCDLIKMKDEIQAIIEEAQSRQAGAEEE